ncbi:MAG: GIY-YIG nuclease family protein, partial [candidate division KSB1 bacterium]
RIVVRYKREFRASYIQGVKYGHQFEVAEIKPQKLTIQPFPGHNRVILPHHHLSTIARHEDPSWKSALSSVKGVYLIVDTTSGRMYVGSATGNSGIWQRWMAYTETGHGGNKELKRLIEKRGLRYANNFQYAILEIADFHATDEEILAREQHWKEVLLSRKKGFNRN